ncbi:unnamed protein product, partial [Owenia fusiformis]
ALCIQELRDRDIGNFQLIFLRIIPHFFIASFWLIKTQRKTNKSENVIIKNNVFSLINSAMFTSCKVMTVMGLRTMAGMGSIYGILSSGRLILVVFLARIFLKASLNCIKLFAVLLSTAGIVFVTQPDLFFHNVKFSVLLRPLWEDNMDTNNDTTTNDTTSSTIDTTITLERIPQIWQGYVITLINAVNESIMTISTRALIKKTTSAPEMFFNMSVVVIFITGIGTCFEGFKTPDNIHDVLQCMYRWFHNRKHWL